MSLIHEVTSQHDTSVSTHFIGGQNFQKYSIVVFLYTIHIKDCVQF